MKLEIKHLAPYFTYKLKYMCLSEINSKEPNIFELKCLDTLINMVNFGHGNAKELDEIKPILRPLSDLIKELEHNEEKFIPLEKLFRLYDEGYFDDKKIGNPISNDKIISIERYKYELLNKEYFILKHEVKTLNIGDLIYSFTYDPSLRRFAIRDESNKRPLGIAYQLDLFNKLFEWHFDIFGLIESGLAVDINSLKL